MAPMLLTTFLKQVILLKSSSTSQVALGVEIRMLTPQFKTVINGPKLIMAAPSLINRSTISKMESYLTIQTITSEAGQESSSTTAMEQVIKEPGKSRFHSLTLIFILEDITLQSKSLKTFKRK